MEFFFVLVCEKKRVFGGWVVVHSLYSSENLHLLSVVEAKPEFV